MYINVFIKSTHKICFLIGLPPMTPVVFGVWGKLRCAKMTELQRRAQMRLLLHFDAWVWQLQGRRARHGHAEAGGGPSLGGFSLHGHGKIRKDQLKDWVVWFLSEIQRDEEKLTEFVSFGCWSFWWLWRTIPSAIMEVEHEGKDYVLPK